MCWLSSKADGRTDFRVAWLALVAFAAGCAAVLGIDERKRDSSSGAAEDGGSEAASGAPGAPDGAGGADAIGGAGGAAAKGAGGSGGVGGESGQAEARAVPAAA